MAIDNLLRKLSQESRIFNLKEQHCKVFNEGFADDLKIMTQGKKEHRNTMIQIGEKAMEEVAKWCEENNMQLNTEKTVAMHFSKKKSKQETLRNIISRGVPIKWVDSTRYLGVQFDNKLSWNEHIRSIINKGIAAIFAAKQAIGNNWGLSPRNVEYIYKAIIIPRMSTGVICWNEALNKRKNIEALNKLHRLMLMMITGARSTTPTIALNELLSMNPLDVELKKKAILCCNRLNAQGNWNTEKRKTGHLKIENFLKTLGTCDLKPNTDIQDKKFKIVIDDWYDTKQEFRGKCKNHQTWFVDGAVSENAVGIGIYGQKSDGNLTEISIPISTTSTSSQAEMKAIELWAKWCLNENIVNEKLTLLSVGHDRSYL